ncbi:alpha/beta hydrolase [archaeon]|nr:alpha/beta hydrolase [archaeon]MBL7057413.1 alpha/beta hydrolase [Candidatus Woesearchaeota archaeon]
MKVFMIHGAYGGPDENWFPWLKKELVSLGYEVIAPKFPTPTGQTLNNWAEIFKPYLSEINEDTIFIGHSLGPAFIMSELEKIDVKIKACFFVSAFIELLGMEEFDSINRTFVERKFDWDNIKRHCHKFFIYHSNNDPYIPVNCGEMIALELSANLDIIEGAGHFNKAAGYTKFERILEDIKKI